MLHVEKEKIKIGSDDMEGNISQKKMRELINQATELIDAVIEDSQGVFRLSKKHLEKELIMKKLY